MEFLPFTGYYITMLAISILLDILFPFLNIYFYFALSIKQIIENYQFWRIFTNFLVTPTKNFNMGILFDIVYLYSNIYKLEQEAKSSRKYSKFIMTILILCILNVIITFLIYFIFEAKESRSLVKELIYSFMAISSYKYPNEKTIVFYIPVRNKYVPLANIFFTISTSENGDLQILRKPIIGFISGYIFCFLVEKMKINITPNILKRLLRESIFERKLFSDNENENQEKKILMNINHNDTTNIAFRKKDSVVEGNEFIEFKKDNIKWE